MFSPYEEQSIRNALRQWVDAAQLRFDADHDQYWWEESCLQPQWVEEDYDF